MEALKHKSPLLMEELRLRGNLEAYIEEMASEISSATTSLALQIAKKHGYDQVKTMMEGVALLNGAIPLAMEIVLAEMLEFPQDETSPQNQD